jgi:hypothetical protein
MSKLSSTDALFSVKWNINYQSLNNILMVSKVVVKSPINQYVTEKNMDKLWENWFTRGLADFVRINNSTPASDPEFMTNGKTEALVEVIDDYIEKLEITNVKRFFIPKREFEEFPEGEEQEEEK